MQVSVEKTEGGLSVPSYRYLREGCRGEETSCRHTEKG